MILKPIPLAGCYLIETKPFKDERGLFERYFCQNEFQKAGLNGNWVQMNHSVTHTKGTVRGLHYQQPPYQEVKLIKCIKGKILDVIVDLRKDSKTFLHSYTAELSENNRMLIYVPGGFAHGFQCLENDCELIYHHSAFYHPPAEAGLRYDDPLLKINWPLPVSNISDRDLSHPYLDKQFKGLQI